MPNTLPTIHLNGTGKKSLLEDYDNALNKLQDAIEEFNKIQFHARDYYVQGPDAYNSALNERIEQAKKLKEVYEYLLAHAVHINES